MYLLNQPTKTKNNNNKTSTTSIFLPQKKIGNYFPGWDLEAVSLDDIAMPRMRRARDTPGDSRLSFLLGSAGSSLSPKLGRPRQFWIHTS